ncbi:MAG: 2-dehydro-3-deoxyphosphogluconate aldolase / 4-hydroxy-2-oxoglutarate aldolase [Spirochaetes bacterium]|nr:MAG: 2-dehydro-3-deoxyphosphogluconate aldolase / 4-hydroxy-2-oxoglutarate aldolase [Spirochaetota bacterium]
MDTIFGEARIEALRKKGILAVMVIDDADDAVPVAKALVEGGITAMELTLRTPAAMEALKRIVAEVPEMTAGVGTIITTGQVHDVKLARVDFGVSPGFNPKIVAEAIKIGLPFAPGISIASEIEGAVELGCRVLKFFPAESMGGIKYLDAINNPYGFLGLQYIPLGGLNMQNLASWLEKDYILAMGGSWIAPKNLIKQKAWDTIRENARAAMKVFHEVRG